nr:hypothetical protein Iba_chr08eCG12140 [Ipomoea batatas]GME10737.1 hypothetical protein Iba_scaffold10620CG0010 [Ipomoea batatas]
MLSIHLKVCTFLNGRQKQSTIPRISSNHLHNLLITLHSHGLHNSHYWNLHTKMIQFKINLFFLHFYHSFAFCFLCTACNRCLYPALLISINNYSVLRKLLLD